MFEQPWKDTAAQASFFRKRLRGRVSAGAAAAATDTLASCNVLEILSHSNGTRSNHTAAADRCPQTQKYRQQGLNACRTSSVQ